MKTLILFLAVVSLLEAAHIDLSAYPFGTTLRNDESNGEAVYQVFWDFDAETETSSFAVRVRTTGWVGFGLSPDGGMIGSDVIIGWVDGSSNVFFHDRYADAQAPPPIDASQDWNLVDGEEVDGYTILQFTRPWVTCDTRDRNIEAETARIVYSWNTVDPADANSVMYHGFTQRGSASLNLLGGQREPVPDPVDVQSFTIAVTDVTIRDSEDTTYWCYATQLPQEVRDEQRYVTRFSPKITSNSFNFVHHMLVYLCTLDPADIETEGICFTGEVGESVSACTSSQLIAAWAVGGADFLYPENVAFPIGGPGNQYGIVIEMHYDNPLLTSGVLDSSGVEFFYTSSPRQHDAGILFVGHAVTFTMVIPPNAADYSILGVCSPTCTDFYFPEDGIHIFANMLHTHTVGHGLEVQHIRENKQCNMTEELRPIDRNLQYDFNYQQITHLEETTVLPGDTILLNCLYTTTGERTVPTVGGLATTDEMCISFLVYYPRVNLTVCDSRPAETAYDTFVGTYLTPEEEALFSGFDGSEPQFRNILAAIDWTDQKVQGLELSLQNTLVGEHCMDDNGNDFYQEVPYPNIQCEYQAADVCTGSVPTPCCERGTPTDATGTTDATMATAATPAPEPIDLSVYPFNRVLRVDGTGEILYELFWDFDTQAETISFAVRVKTMGWVGFGLSPNGGMIGSDVVIGWVTENSVYFHDRYADAQALPPIDESQDWSLVRGQELDGHTILEFTRSWVTCDIRDRNVEDNTARVVFSWNNDDPADADSAMYHGMPQRGSASLNLLGGQREIPPDPIDVQSFTIAVNNVIIPDDDTTYWCAATQLPPEVREQERFITRYSPRITENDFELVHHMLIYLCILDEADIDTQGVCNSAATGESVDQCTSGQLIAGWAVGGEDFVYPENVAFPIGGPGSRQHIVIELHYDNPDRRDDIVDSSGMEFFYTSTRREHDAGILQAGHTVSDLMVVPPNAANYTVVGQCSSECTSQYLPNGGIKVFANLLHTHLVGTGLVLQRIRQNQQCNMAEELSPIDSNLQYDFNFQQFTYFNEEVTVLPGDTLLLNCFYTTTGTRTGVTLGGLSTLDEMCLSFLVYYPRTGLDICLSIPALEAFGPFVANYVPENQQAAILAASNSTDSIRNALNQLEWSNDQVQGLEQTLVNGPLHTFCDGDNGFSFQASNSNPDVQCDYQASDPCNPSNTPVDCCDRRGGEAALAANFLFVVALFAISCLMF